MQIYVTHATSFDFRNELYAPIKSLEIFSQHSWILPHDVHDKPLHSKAMIQQSDLILAEVSYPSTGQGIELGWAENFGNPILCFYQSGKNYSHSLRLITNYFFAYKNANDLGEQLTKLFHGYNAASAKLHHCEKR